MPRGTHCIQLTWELHTNVSFISSWSHFKQWDIALGISLLPNSSPLQDCISGQSPTSQDLWVQEEHPQHLSSSPNLVPYNVSSGLRWTLATESIVIFIIQSLRITRTVVYNLCVWKASCELKQPSTCAAIVGLNLLWPLPSIHHAHIPTLSTTLVPVQVNDDCLVIIHSEHEWVNMLLSLHVKFMQ